MNVLQIVVCGLVTSIAGVVIGIGLATINQDDPNPNATTDYAAIGAIAGLAVGCGQQALRELASDDTD
jgi:hypothetical protein